ncbi:CAP domain-containing protein [Sediminitomix flava]|uniref:Cysteine-rich secretory protein family protein n=1 Tax=Sediminitomix flava TaxID=379075 RepID=A0A315YXU8_SEDFL|nr:CAP domain-containing protein [Sediminitomix flava]PWJ34122.1 Cysteine-rich secretory protein family protein [Sediminitomix flava]
MRNKKLSIIVCLSFLLLFTSFNSSERSAWNVEMYDQYTYKSYTSYEAFSENLDSKTLDIPLLNAAIFYETNRERAKKKLPLFIYSKEAERASLLHSEDMSKGDFFSHSNPQKGRETTSKRLEKEGVHWQVCAENIAIGLMYPLEDQSYFPPSVNKGYFSLEYQGKPITIRTYAKMAVQIVKMWMDSKPHRANILNPKFTHLGCGNYPKKVKKQDQVPQVYSTQNFFTYFKEDEGQNK